MRNLACLLIVFGIQSWAAINSEIRNLKSLYAMVNDYSKTDKVENDPLILKDYHLLISSSTWWAGSARAESMWEKLAQERARELNIVVVYDQPKQDFLKIKTKSPMTKMYEFYDQSREFYYWFSQKTLMDAVLIGPNGKVIFEGILNTPAQVEQVKALVKKKEA